MILLVRGNIFSQIADLFITGVFRTVLASICDGLEIEERSIVLLDDLFDEVSSQSLYFLLILFGRLLLIGGDRIRFLKLGDWDRFIWLGDWNWLFERGGWVGFLFRLGIVVFIVFIVDDQLCLLHTHYLNTI